MRRRAIFRLIAGAPLLSWARAASTQPALKTVGVLIALPETDPSVSARVAGFETGLREFGWSAARNIQLRYRFAEDTAQLPRLAGELVASAPDVLVASSGIVAAALLRHTRTIPIVFVTTSDPIGDGLVTSLARPDGNVTGFTNSLSTMGGKWVELLKQAVPDMSRVGMIFNPDTAPGGGSYFLASFEEAAKSNALRGDTLPVRTREEIEPTLTTLGRAPGPGLIVVPDNFSALHRDLIIAQATKQRIPAIYPFRYFAAEGGFMSYGVDLPDLYKRTASYVDRLLKGAKVIDLPVQASSRLHLVINLRAAKALGLTLSRTMLARADEILE
ncbi:MAG: ABC transporter substrate-binding protein [Xanthobacteraceae bacterium]|nr:ABC transporter substrate-binding protein [Xanthobacteraceae bacterium]